MKAEATSDNTQQLPVSLPLFPLKTWLYPGVPLLLQVFERRYLDMISQQLKRGEGFGIVPIRAGKEVGQAPSIFPVGVEVRVADWDQTPAGLLTVRVSGQQKFRVLRTHVDAQELMTAEVEYLSTDQAQPIGSEYEGLVELLEKLKDHPAAQEMALPQVTDTSQLSYQLAWLLPMHAEEKLAALTLSSPVARLQLLAKKVAELSR